MLRTSTNQTLKTGIAAMVVGTGLVAFGHAAVADDGIHQQGYIAGSMVIDWNSRLPRNRENDAAKPGVADVFNMDVAVGNTFYRGKIECLPYVFSRHIGRVIQEGTCRYDIDLGVINPADRSQQRVVGKLVGSAPMDREGRVDLEAGGLRAEVQTIGRAQGFTSNFAGAVLATPVKARTTLSGMIDTATKQSATLTRMVGGNAVNVTLGDVDPVTFQQATVAAGPSANYTAATIDGQMIYSYDTDNWFPSFKATHAGQTDTFSGGMKWVDVSDTSGHYELNILVNEGTAPQDEYSAFEEDMGEEAFFMASPSRPTINGRISFQDTYIGGVEAPTRSEVKYDVGVQDVTAQQAQVFWKAMLLIPNQLYGE
jgi:hypothetical protein